MIYMYLHLDENMSFLVWGIQGLDTLHASPFNSVKLLDLLEDWVWNWWFSV